MGSQAAGAAAVDVRDRRHATPLHAACRSGRLETVQWLVTEGGARLDAQDDRGATPLHAAAFYGKSDVVRWLLAEANDSAGDAFFAYQKMQAKLKAARQKKARKPFGSPKLKPEPGPAAGDETVAPKSWEL